MADGFRYKNGDPYPCKPCPKNALDCSHGKAICEPNYIFIDNSCVLNSNLIKLSYNIEKQVINQLSILRGRNECGYGNNYKMNKDYLLSHIYTNDISLLNDSWNYFIKYLLPKNNLIIFKNDLFYVNISKKPLYCKLVNFFNDNKLFFILFSIIFIICILYYIKLNHNEWEIKESTILVKEVYDLLEEARQYNNIYFIPIDSVKQQLKPKNERIWYMVNKQLRNDVNIQKSMRMINGIQKECYGLINTYKKQKRSNFVNNNAAYWKSM